MTEATAAHESLGRSWWRAAQRGITAAVRAVEAVPPAAILGTFVAVQWIAVFTLARRVTHNGWIYYQGGDQLWYWSTGWLLAHGHMPQALVGYGWSTLLAPLAAIFGPNFAQGLPVIIVLDFVVMLPVALVAAYGIGHRIGGRLFGYWVALLWIAVPFIGIRYTNAGYHQRYTEVTLPQALGLTGMADFPTMVLMLVSAYFVLRTIQGGAWIDAAVAGLVGGLAIGVKPSSALYLVGVALAFAWSRRWRPALLFAAAFAPSLVALALWKWRGYGYLPLLQHSSGSSVRLATGLDVPAQPLAGLSLHRYVNLDFHHLRLQLDSVREHFWSVRVVEWSVIAGAIGLARRSGPAALLFGGWFGAFVLVKGTFAQSSIDDSSLLRIMIPSIPAFLLLIASIPLLLPGMPQRLRGASVRPWGTRRLHVPLVAALVATFAVAPMGLALAGTPLTATDGVAFTVDGNMPVPVDRSWHVQAKRVKGGVLVTWEAHRPRAGQVFYRVFRSRAGTPHTCGTQNGSGAISCALTMDTINTTREGATYDKPGSGRWTYRVGLAANWTNDPAKGDTYVLTAPVTIGVR